MQMKRQQANGTEWGSSLLLRWGQGARGVFASGLMAAAMACGISDEGKLPPDVQDNSQLRTPKGAVGLYRQALADFPVVLDEVILVGGVLTDELAVLPLPLGTSRPFTGLDSRQAPSFSPGRLHQLRAQAREARNFLKIYASDSSPALPGHMYALEGYADIFLAELFCSGIPLSTVDVDDYTLAAGSTTEEVYEHALALFDTALALASDSVRVQHLASVGRGRALLSLKRYAEAAAAVTGVPTDYRYEAPVSVTSAFPVATLIPPDTLVLPWYWTRPTANNSTNNSLRVGAPSVANQEGGNGLDYRSSGDPRVQVLAKGVDPSGNTFFMPRKYTVNGTSVQLIRLVLADGIEARLIEAEAAFQANPADGLWLQHLNGLRQTAWQTIFPAISGPLPDLTDPGTDAARVGLLFRERAFWLYLTGHRQGDLRRLIRQYDRFPETVYPTGAYPGSSGQYGAETVIPMPDRERQVNPKYTGCINLNA